MPKDNFNVAMVNHACPICGGIVYDSVQYCFIDKEFANQIGLPHEKEKNI